MFSRLGFSAKYRNCPADWQKNFSEEAVAEIGNDREVPSGVLTITTAMDYGVRFVVPVVRAYMGKFPDMHVDLSMDDRKVDIVDSNIDVSIRVGWLKDSSARARKIGDFHQIPVAAPCLLSQHGGHHRLN